jgi:hypothetical protein
LLPPLQIHKIHFHISVFLLLDNTHFACLSLLFLCVYFTFISILPSDYHIINT